MLERAPQGFYRDALRKGRLSKGLEQLATTVGSQGVRACGAPGRSPREPRPFRAAPRLPGLLANTRAFGDTVIELEEATIAAYIGHTANLTRDAVAAVAPLLSVEARHVAWLRDLASVSPTPLAADPRASRMTCWRSCATAGPSHERPDAAGCRPRRGAREAIAELYGSTRAGFLRTAAPGGAAMLGTLLAAPDAAAKVSDVGILNIGLGFERLPRHARSRAPPDDRSRWQSRHHNRVRRTLELDEQQKRHAARPN